MKRFLIFLFAFLSISLNQSFAKNLSAFSTSLGTYGYKETGSGDWVVFPMFQKVGAFDSENNWGMVSYDGEHWALISGFSSFYTGFIFPHEVFWNKFMLGVYKNGENDYRLMNIKGQTLLNKTVPIHVLGDRIAIQYNPDAYTIVDHDMKQISVDQFKSFKDEKIKFDKKEVSYVFAKMASRGDRILDARGNTIIHFDALVPVPGSPIPSTNFGTAGWVNRRHFLRLAKRYGKWGVVTLNGTTVIPFEYSSEKKVYAAFQSKINKEVVRFLKTKFESDFDAFCQKILQSELDARAELKKKYPGVPTAFYDVPFAASYSDVVTSGGKSYISDNGKPKGEAFLNAKNAGYFIIATRKNGKKYLYNCWGMRMCETGFDDIETHGYNKEKLPFFKIKNKGKYGLMDFTSNVVLSPTFDKLGYISDREKVMVGERGGKQYAIDAQKGILLSDIGYDKIEIYSAKNGRIPVRRKGFDITINENGLEEPRLEKQLFDKAYQMSDNDAEEKIAAYRTCLSALSAKDPLIGDCYNNIGVVHEKSNNLAEAKKMYVKAAGYGCKIATDNLSSIESRENMRRNEQLAHNHNHNHNHNNNQSGSNGRVECPNCHATGLCYLCKGTGVWSPGIGPVLPCFICNGQRSCTLCNGAAYVTQADIDLYRARIKAQTELNNMMRNSDTGSSGSYEDNLRYPEYQRYNDSRGNFDKRKYQQIRQSECSACNGTGINPYPDTGLGGIRIKHFNPEGTKCPICGNYYSHHHDKCASCVP